jgi:glycosyltransferase involved in cell wall biosynthesis
VESGTGAASPGYLVVIPAFNCAGTIAGLVRALRAQGLDVLVVDDGSTDQTARAAAAEQALVISHLGNQGKGRALRSAFERAARGAWRGVVTMDADGQHDPADVPRLISAGEEQHAAIVLGNRMGDLRRIPPARRWTNRVMSGLVSMFARQRIPDSQCGLRLIRREALAALRLRACRFEAESELILEAARHRLKIVSVPVRAIYDGRPSHIRPLGDTWRFLGVLARHAGLLLRR